MIPNPEEGWPEEFFEEEERPGCWHKDPPFDRNGNCLPCVRDGCMVEFSKDELESLKEFDDEG